MDLVFFFTHFASSRYPLPFLIFELLFIRDGLLFFPGFRAKKFPWLNFHFFYYYYYVNNRGSWD